jgi:hypothetical protein
VTAHVETSSVQSEPAKPRSRRTRFIRRAVLLVPSMVFVSACTTASSLAPSASAGTSAPSGLPSPSSTADISVSAWREVDPSPFAHMTEFYPPAWSGARFIVAGHPQTTPPRRTDDVQIWTSGDGKAWSMSPVSSRGYSLAYAFDGAAGVAVGSQGEQAAVWTSPDSWNWTRLPNPAALTLASREISLALSDVAHGPAGYVALAQLGIAPNKQETIGESLVLWSPDGQDWHRVAIGSFDSSDLEDVIVVHGRYVITGTVYAAGSASPTLWSSVDGRDWAKEPRLEDGPSVFIALAAGKSGALLTGNEPRPGFSDTCVDWRSLDGLTWARIDGGCPNGLTGLVAAPFGFVASTPMPVNAASGSGSAKPTDLTTFPCAGGIEVSATGERWTCVLPPPAAGDLEVAASETVLLITGSRVSPSGLGVWLADVRIGP